MQITKREFLKKLGLAAAAGAAGAARGDEYVYTDEKLPARSVGDPNNVWFGKNIFEIPHTVEDGPSCFMKDGRIFMPAREVPKFHEVDVAVVGGGPAGFAAAVAAARAGAKTAIIEKSGSLGGLFTNGMVLIMLASCARDEDDAYHLVTKSVCEEFMKRATAMGKYASTQSNPLPRLPWCPTVDPEAAKYLMDKMCAEAGVETFFHAAGIDVVQDGDDVKGVVFSSKQGFQAVLAKVTVDCSGDGDVFFAAGESYRQITHAIGMSARLGNVDRIKPKNATFRRSPPGDPNRRWPRRGNEGNPSTYWGGELGPKGDGLSVRDLSKAEVALRKNWWEHVENMRKVPGWEEVFVLNTASQIGPRATRILESATVVDRDLIERNGNLKDPIGVFGSDGVHWGSLQVPYQALLPKRAGHLLAAGRCIGAPDTIDHFRLICPCFVTGQAAGVAAALSAAKGCEPRDLPYGDLRAELLKQDVLLEDPA